MALVDERGRRFTWGGGVNPNWVAKIEMTTQPTNTQYANNPLDLTGMVITATKRDGTTEVVTNKVICNREVWGNAVETVVTFGYHEKACYWTVTPTAVIPASMTVKTAPTKTEYKLGEDIDLTGAVLEVTYNDSHKADVAGTADGVSVSPTTMGEDTASVTISYTEGETTVTASQAVTLVYPTALAVKTAPTKTAYKYGESISLLGAVLEVTYSDSDTAEVEGTSESVSVSPTTMGADTESVTITYTEGLVSVTATQAVTLVAPDSASIETPAEKLTYVAGEEVDLTGLTLEITYDDESTAVVSSGFTASPTEVAADTTSITVTYTEGDVSVSTGYDITVTEG